jgi:hypothetical protein
MGFRRLEAGRGRRDAVGGTVDKFWTMDDAPKVQLVVLQGGCREGTPGSAERLPREALRIIPGGPAGDLQAAIEETVLAARKVRQEIEERIARALEELF